MAPERRGRGRSERSGRTLDEATRKLDEADRKVARKLDEARRRLEDAEREVAQATGPIWGRPEPGARRARFTREEIAEAALAVADAEGFDAVSMRRVASELGAGTRRASGVRPASVPRASRRAAGPPGSRPRP